MAETYWIAPEDQVPIGEMVDPALWELAESGSPVEEIAIMIRLEPGAKPPKSVRVVATFGTIMTARCARGDIMALRRAPGVISVKAGRPVTLPRSPEHSEELDTEDADVIEDVDVITEPEDFESLPLPPR